MPPCHSGFKRSAIKNRILWRDAAIAEGYMSALSKRWSAIKSVLKIWQSSRTGPVSDFTCCADHEVERMARDLSISFSELHRLASLGPQSADLLLRRMAALDLDKDEVCEIAPQTLRELQRTCALCANKRLCARDFARNGGNNPAWQSYCPNAATLMALNALPWASRSEW
jgi:hypothetical protein